MRMGFLVLCLATGALPAEGLHIRQNLEVGQEESLRGKQVNYLIVKIGRLKRDLVRLEARLQKMEEESRDGSESKAAVKREFGALDRRIDLLEKRGGAGGIQRKAGGTHRKDQVGSGFGGEETAFVRAGGAYGGGKLFFRSGERADAGIRTDSGLEWFETEPPEKGVRDEPEGFGCGATADRGRLYGGACGDDFPGGVADCVGSRSRGTKMTVEDGFSLRVENGEVRLGYTILLGDEK